MDRVGGAGRDEPNVGDRACRPCVALVDRVAAFVDQKTAIEVGSSFNGPAVSVEPSTVEQHRAAFVDGFELHPHIESVNRAAGEEMTDLTRANDHVHTNGIAGLDPRVDSIERSNHLTHRLHYGTRGAEVQRLLAHREGAGRLRFDTGANGGGACRRITAHQRKDVHGDLAIAQELLHLVQLRAIAVHERHRGVRSGKAMRSHHAVFRRRIGRCHERHVAIGALLRLSAGSRTSARPRPRRPRPASCRSR